MKILIGSQALSHYMDEIKPKDTDYFSDHKIYGAEVFYDPRLENYQWTNGTDSIPTLNELYTIKVSHAFWSLRNRTWKKHMGHILKMQEHNAIFIPELYDVLYPIWVDLHGSKKAKLNQSAEEFFNSNVKRIYEHDSIHASIAYYDEPLFNKILRDGSEVAVSREKFEALSHEDKLKLVREEIFATALERRVIASGGKDWRVGYQWALEKTITSFSSGWFPLFIVLNFNQLHLAPFNYYDKMMENKNKLVLL